MYLDHRVTTKIARILNMIDVNALLLDNSGAVILPEGDTRSLNLPDAVRHESDDAADLRRRYVDWYERGAAGVHLSAWRQRRCEKVRGALRGADQYDAA